MADRRLQVFHAVAKHRSFTKAADALFMSQPAVTFQVKNLEEEYNTRLFERRHGAISLTPAGELLLSYAEKIQLLSDEMATRLGELSGEMRGLFLIGASTSLAESVMPALLGEFTALYPQVRPRLLVANSETVANRVAEHALDLGLVEASGELAGLVCEACGEEELQIVCAPDYPLAAQKRITPASLLDYEYLSRESGSGTRRSIEHYLQKHKIRPDSLKMQMELGSPAALKAVLASGWGFAILGRAQVEKEIERKELVAISLTPTLKQKFHLVYPQGRFCSRMTSTFIEFAKHKLRELVA